MNQLFVTLWLAVSAGFGGQQILEPCEASDADAWVRETRDRVLSFDELVQYAAARYGPPSECRGSVTAEFDGMTFGSLVLRFGDDSVFTVETQPPESSAVTLRVAAGFADPESAREALRAYALDVGLDIDWTTPEVTREQDERVETFWDPASGVNGSASFVFSGDTLVALRFSLGL